MEISFYIDEIYYHGTAVPYEKPGNTETQFVVRLENMPVFHVFMHGNGEWASDDMKSADLVSSVGAEIDNRNDTETVTPLEPGRYYSKAVTGGENPLIKNGEIINEPDDVDEQAIRQ
jgi:hypothetical protein